MPVKFFDGLGSNERGKNSPLVYLPLNRKLIGVKK
jgi:hypothetical protein